MTEVTEKDERSELAERIRDGEVDLIDELWASCERLTGSVVGRALASPFYHERAIIAGVDDEDLKQECFLAFSRGVMRYQVRENCKFSTFIFTVMSCAIKDYIRKKGKHPVESLERPVSEGDEDLRLIDAIPDPDSEKPFEELTRREYVRKLRADLDFAIMDLNKQHRDVIVSRYYQRKNRDQTAAALGLTPGYISQLESEALADLRKSQALREYRPAGYKEPEEARPVVSKSWARAMIDEEE